MYYMSNLKIVTIIIMCLINRRKAPSQVSQKSPGFLVILRSDDFWAYKKLLSYLTDRRNPAAFLYYNQKLCYNFLYHSSLYT